MSSRSQAMTLRSSNTHVLWTLVALSLAVSALFFLMSIFDARLLDGVNIWSKPLKFALSFAVLFLTMSMVAQRLSEPVQNGKLMTIVALSLVVNFFIEMIYISSQAAQVQHSHWNFSSSFTIKMYSLMGISAVGLVAAVFVMGIAVKRDQHAQFMPMTKAAIVYGFILSSILTFFLAGYMSTSNGHFVGTPPPGAPVLPLVGWSAAVGDLRPAHFLALHAMQVLPILGIILDHKKIVRKSLVITAAVVYVCLDLAVFVQALNGNPLIAL